MLSARALLITVFLSFPNLISSQERPTGASCVGSSLSDKCGGLANLCTTDGLCVVIEDRCAIEADTQQDCNEEVDRDLGQDALSANSSGSNRTHEEDQGSDPDALLDAAADADGYEALGGLCVAGTRANDCGGVLNQCTSLGVCSYNQQTQTCIIDEVSAEKCAAERQAYLDMRSSTTGSDPDAPLVGAGGAEDFEALGERCVAGALDDKCGDVLDQCTLRGVCTYNKETNMCETDARTQQQCVSAMEEASSSTALTRAWSCAEAELRDAEGRTCVASLRHHLASVDASWRRNRSAGEVDTDSGKDEWESDSDDEESDAPGVAWSADTMCQRRCVARAMDVLPVCWSIATARRDSPAKQAEATNDSSWGSGRRLFQKAPEQAADEAGAAEVDDVDPATGQSQRAAESFARNHLARVVQWCSTPEEDGSRRWRDDRYVYEAAGSDAAAGGENGEDGSYSGVGMVRGVLACATQAAGYACERELRFIVDEVDHSMNNHGESDDESDSGSDESDSDSLEGERNSTGAWPAASREPAEVCVSRCMNQALKFVPTCWESVTTSTQADPGGRRLAQKAPAPSDSQQDASITPANDNGADAATPAGKRAGGVGSSVLAILNRMAKRCARANNQQMDEWLGSSEDAASTDFNALMWEYVNRCAVQKTAADEDVGGSSGLCTRPLRQLAAEVESDLRQRVAEQGGAGRGGDDAGGEGQCMCPCAAEGVATPVDPAPTRRLLVETSAGAAAASRRSLQQAGPGTSQPQSAPGQNADDAAASQESSSMCACACDDAKASRVPVAGGEDAKGRRLLQSNASSDQDAYSAAPAMCDDRCMKDANRILPQCWEDALESVRSDSTANQAAYEESTGVSSGASGRRLFQKESSAAPAGQQDLEIGARNISASLLRIQARCANGDQQTTQTPAQVGSEDAGTREKVAQNATEDTDKPTDSPTVSSQDQLRLALTQPNGSGPSSLLASSVMAGLLVSAVLLGV
mmetsp:Transcript_49337/g.94290  ORF Transcript_49337/g.94290 Transcript_49337/m.94290 type:complete len:985 (+) Transcript_49337:42-2996(+)